MFYRPDEDMSTEDEVQG